MADNVESLMLEHLKRFQGTLDRVEGKIGDLTNRMANVENSLASVIQHLGHLASADAAQQLSSDRMGERLDRIERRLELTN